MPKKQRKAAAEVWVELEKETVRLNEVCERLEKAVAAYNHSIIPWNKKLEELKACREEEGLEPDINEKLKRIIVKSEDQWTPELAQAVESGQFGKSLTRVRNQFKIHSFITPVTPRDYAEKISLYHIAPLITDAVFNPLNPWEGPPNLEITAWIDKAGNFEGRHLATIENYLRTLARKIVELKWEEEAFARLGLEFRCDDENRLIGWMQSDGDKVRRALGLSWKEYEEVIN